MLFLSAQSKRLHELALIGQCVSLPTLIRLKTNAYSFLGDAQFCKTILFRKKEPKEIVFKL